MISIRNAHPQDAQGIAQVIQIVWNDNANTARIARLIQENDNYLWVAVSDESEIVGFADGFLTVSSSGEKRLEVDLLAVHPDFRGLKLANQLIEKVTLAGIDAGAQYARAVVRVENIPSEKAFAHHGYHPVSRRDLWVSDGQPSADEPTSAYFVSVNTLTYQGVWIEDVRTRSAFSAGRHIAHQNSLDTVGALLDPAHAEQIEWARQCGFEKIAEMQVWTRPFELRGG